MATFTLVHVVLSLVGIGSGLVVLWGLLSAKRLEGWTALFLTTTAATSATGFGFPVDRFLPSHAIGIVSLVVLTIATVGRYRFHLAGGWRQAYAITSIVALYLNVFVLIVQAYLKVPALNALAPTQTEAPFAITQLVALAIFGALGVLAARRFHPELSGKATVEPI